MSKTIDEKIKKLLRLAKSDNEHEARLALARARKLMAEHKLDIKDFDESERRLSNSRPTFIGRHIRTHTLATLLVS